MSGLRVLALVVTVLLFAVFAASAGNAFDKQRHGPAITLSLFAAYCAVMAFGLTFL